MNNIKELPTTILIVIIAVVAIILITVITLIIIKQKKKQKKQQEQIITQPINNNEVTMDNNINTPTETPAGINMFNQNINTNINPVNQFNPTTETDNNIVEPAVEQNIQMPVNNIESANPILHQETNVQQATNQINPTINNNEQQLFVYNPNNNQTQVSISQQEPIQSVEQPINNFEQPNITASVNNNVEQFPEAGNQTGNPNN